MKKISFEKTEKDTEMRKPEEVNKGLTQELIVEVPPLRLTQERVEKVV